MSIITDDDEAAFARPIIGALGKLTEEVKTKVDEHTLKLFQRHCEMSGTTQAGLVRDFIYLAAHGKTYRAMAAEKMLHDQERIDALRVLTGPIEGPELTAGGLA